MKSIRNLLIPICVFIFIGGAIISHAQDQCKPVGWATQNGGVTGGGLGLSTTVTTYAQLKSACESSTYKVVYVSGDITLPSSGRINIQNQSGKTLFGLPGSSITSVDLTASGSGIFYIKGCTNFIMRNLVLIGPGAYDVDGNDNLTLDNCQNFWVDHCEFHDGMDGNFDMKNMTDYISVTWCTFSYEKAPIPGGSGGTNDHRFSDLIGSSDNATQDDGKLRITFQYCWWGQGCVERMPRVRFGKIHLVNNYYSSTVSNTCIRAGFKADLLIEGNLFENVNKPIDLYNNDFTAVTARNNSFVGTSGNTAGSGTSFTPPYTLSITGVATIKSMITNASCGSGATLDSPTQCGCGTTPGNVKPTVSLTAPTNNSSYCPGASISISANAADSDGSISSVSFFRGSTLIGTDNSSPYSFSWTNTVPGTYNLTAVATDNLGATTTSAGISVTFNTTNIPNIAISSSSLSVCSGTSITLTATSTNGGTTPTIAWFRNNGQVSTGATYSYTPSNGDVISARLTAGGTLPACLSPTTDVSNVINLTVTPVSVPNIAISSSSLSVCSGTSITLTATSTNGGTTPTITWFRNNGQVSTSATYSYTPSNGDVISARLTAGGTLPACLSPTTDVSNVINLTVTPVSVPNIAISSSLLSVCSGTSITLTATSTNGGTTPTIAWFRNNGQVSTGATYSYTPSNGDVISARLTAGGTLPACLSPTTDVSNVINLTVTPVSVPNIAISSSSLSVCSGTSITLTATSTNGGTTPTIAWFRNNGQVATGATYSYTPSNGDVISARLTAGGTLPACLSPTTDVSNVINLTVTPVSAPNIAISSSSLSVCSGTSITLTATSTNGGTTPTIAWFRNNGQVSSGATYSYTPSNGDVISARLTAGGTLPACLSPTTVISNLINVSVNPVLTPSVTISSTVNSVCSGTGMSFTATGSNLGNTPAYSWTVNSVVRGSGTIFTYFPSNGDLVRATLSTSGNCFAATSAQSNVLQPVVNSPLTASVSVSPSANPVCSGTGVVYTATAVNVGTAPVYTWRVNGSVRTGSTSVFNFTPSNGDIITASVSAGGTLPNCLVNTSATSTGVNATVNGTIITSLAIGTPTNSFCQGNSVTLTATASGTGSAPVYAWYVNSVKQVSNAANFTYIPSQGDVVQATMTPGGNGTTCILGGLASSSGVTLTVLGLQSPAVSISSNSTAYCAGSLATFTANAINGGTAPVYTWFINGSLQSSGKTFSYSPSNADQVTAKLSVGGTLPTCLTASTATSSSIVVSVNSLNSPSVAISTSAASLCSGTGVTLTALGINAGSLPSIEWFKNNLSVATGTTYSYTPANGDVIVAKLTVGGTLPTCLSSTTALSNVVGLTVTVCLKPQVSSITGPSIVLDGAQDVVYTVPNVSGDTYQWTLPSGATIVSGQGTNSITVSFGSGVSGPISMTQTNANGSTQVQLDVNSGVPPVKPTITGTSAVLDGSTSVAFSIPSVAGVSYQWTVPAGVSIVSGQGTNTLLVDFGTNVLGDIGVSVTNSFGTTSASLEVSSGAVPSVGTISGPAAVLANQSGVAYAISSVAGISYQWTVPAGATIVSGQGTNSIIVDFGGNVAGNVSVIASNTYGNSSTSLAITETIPTDYSPSIATSGIKIYPNPSQQGFTVESTTAEVKVINIHGETIDQFSLRIKSSFGENYPAGVYVVQLSNSAGVTNTVRLVKLN